MNNEDFFQQFRQMFSDPFQRRELVEYFDKLVLECTASPKPMRVAFIGVYDDFVEVVRMAGGDFKNEMTFDIVQQHEFTVGGLTLVHCVCEEDVYGKPFDAFVMYNTKDVVSKFYNACFYLSGHNVPRLTEFDFLKLIEEHKKSLEYA